MLVCSARWVSLTNVQLFHVKPLQLPSVSLIFSLPAAYMTPFAFSICGCQPKQQYSFLHSIFLSFCFFFVLTFARNVSRRFDYCQPSRNLFSSWAYHAAQAFRPTSGWYYVLFSSPYSPLMVFYFYICSRITNTTFRLYFVHGPRISTPTVREKLFVGRCSFFRHFSIFFSLGGLWVVRCGPRCFICNIYQPFIDFIRSHIQSVSASCAYSFAAAFFIIATFIGSRCECGTE